MSRGLNPRKVLGSKDGKGGMCPVKVKTFFEIAEPGGVCQPGEILRQLSRIERNMEFAVTVEAFSDGRMLGTMLKVPVDSVAAKVEEAHIPERQPMNPGNYTVTLTEEWLRKNSVLTIENVVFPKDYFKDNPYANKETK